MLGEPNTEQFTITTRVDGRVVNQRAIHDPFITNTTVLGLNRWAAFKAIFRRQSVVIEVSIKGTPAVTCAVMLLDPVSMAAENLEAEQWRQDREPALNRKPYG